MPLGDITVRPEWQSIEIRERSERVTGRAVLQLAIVLYGLVALAIAAWPPHGWLQLLQALLFALAFLWMPLYVSLRDRQGSRTTLSVAGLVLLVVVVVAAVTAPALSPWPPTSVAPVLPWFSLVIPPAMVGLLAWATRRHPGLSYELGLTRRAVGYHTAIGLGLGVMLGFSLWAALAALPREPSPTAHSQAALIWVLATGAGLTALGEEIALRGALFRMLVAESRGLGPAIFLRILLLGSPLYMTTLFYGSQATAIPLALLYGTAFGVLAITLRAGLKSITASLAANVAFHVFLALLVVA